MDPWYVPIQGGEMYKSLLPVTCHSTFQQIPASEVGLHLVCSTPAIVSRLTPKLNSRKKTNKNNLVSCRAGLPLGRSWKFGFLFPKRVSLRLGASSYSRWRAGTWRHVASSALSTWRRMGARPWRNGWKIMISNAYSWRDPLNMLICKSTLGITNDFGLFVVGIFDSIVLVWDIFFHAARGASLLIHGTVHPETAISVSTEAN